MSYPAWPELTGQEWRDAVNVLTANANQKTVIDLNDHPDMRTPKQRWNMKTEYQKYMSPTKQKISTTVEDRIQKVLMEIEIENTLNAWCPTGPGGGKDNSCAPNSGGTEEWKSKGGFENTGLEWKQETNSVTGRPIPIKVDTVELAAELVLQGKVVEVPTVKIAHTLIQKLADAAKQAKTDGKEAKEFDLCNVTVAGSSMFCAESLRSEEYPNGVPRLKMPQLGGTPVPGSEADKLARNSWDETQVDGSAHFIAHLQGIGIKTSREEIPSDRLRASQAELIGTRVAAMMEDKNYSPGKNPIFISSDNYIVDGHHRWAAVVGRDAENGQLGTTKINAIRVNAPISEVLHLANAWSEKFGIQQEIGVAGQSKEIKVKNPTSNELSPEWEGIFNNFCTRADTEEPLLQTDELIGNVRVYDPDMEELLMDNSNLEGIN